MNVLHHSLHEHASRRNDDTPLVIVPTPVIALTRPEAYRLLEYLLETPDCLNRYIVPGQLKYDPSTWFWFDLASLSREVPTFMADLKNSAACLVHVGCRVNTTSHFWLKKLAQMVRTGIYAGEGMSWISQHYAVVAAPAVEVTRELQKNEVSSPLLYVQDELAPTALHVVPPVSPWN